MAHRARPTLETVAERAEVSRQTVSNVLNAPHVVADATRDRVLAAIDELGYRPNVAARQLRTRRSWVLGLRVPPASDGISGQVLDRFLHALTEVAQQAGLRIMLFTSGDDADEVREYQNLHSTAGVDGFVLANTHAGDGRTRWLTEQAIPFVTFGRPWDGDRSAADHAWIDIDGRSGIHAATRHLLDAGHRKIAFLGWPEGSGVGDDRYAGYLDALRTVPTAAPPLVRRCEDGVPTGMAAAADVLADDDVTALVCVSDSIALGAMAAIRDLAHTRPRRPAVALTGFDDTPVARAVDLTSVAQPVDRVAARAVGLLLSQMRPADQRVTMSAADRHVLIEPRLVVRATSQVPV
ncbi:MAG: LacI family DNA-binding transcriptional regulator [Promicromonosporaceae bacterium]|nr:LacI family DNA-binding transcriptional regulator [Promicromonosporaceae bacterium]